MNVLTTLFGADASRTALVIYAAMIIGSILSIVRCPRYSLYILIPLLPLQTLRSQLHILPGGDQLVDILLLSGYIGLFMRSKEFPPPSTRFSMFLVFVGFYCFISLCWGSLYLHADLPYSPSDPRVSDWKCYIELFLMYGIVSRVFTDKSQFRILLGLMILSVLAADYAYLRTVADRDFSRYSDSARYAGVFGYAGENGAAAFMAQFVIFCLALRHGLSSWMEKLAIWVVIALTFLCLGVSFSRGGYLGLVMGLFFLGLVKERKWLVVILILLSSWQAILPSGVKDRITMSYRGGELDESAQERIMLWEDATQLIKENPIMGTGFVTYRYLGRTIYSDTHNYYMKAAVEMGAIGLFLLFAIQFSIFRYGWRLFIQAKNDKFLSSLGLAMAALLVTSAVVNFFGDRWTYHQISGYTWTFLALVVRSLDLTAEEKVKESEPEKLALYNGLPAEVHAR